MIPNKQKITPFLWFDHEAEEAAKYYVSIFKNSKILHVARYGKAASEAIGQPAGSVMTVKFQLEGQEFIALNGGPVPGFKFSPAISLFVECKTQAEVDRLWEKLSRGGKLSQCGWLDDKFGVTWQIVPRVLGETLYGKDVEGARRAMQAMLQMTKLDGPKLKAAYAGKSGKPARRR